MHSLAAASRPRMSEIEPKWFMFETSSYAFGKRIRRLWTTYAAECKSIMLFKVYNNECLSKNDALPFRSRQPVDVRTFEVTIGAIQRSDECQIKNHH